ncbi:MAG: DNA replication complex subunit Gins51 [Candidatus Bathycorpusculaceae bacterium]
MYNELYDAWKRELENLELVKLPDDFYSRVADYLKRIREESRMLDKRTVKAVLLKKEMKNVKRMLRELTRARYKKLVKKAVKGEKIPLDSVTSEEKKIFVEMPHFAEAYQNFVKNLIQGHFLRNIIEREHKIVVLRFVKDVPAIIGSDMKTYGPFKVEDVAPLPAENAKILIKQGLAEKVEVFS